MKKKNKTKSTYWPFFFSHCTGDEKLTSNWGCWPEWGNDAKMKKMYLMIVFRANATKGYFSFSLAVSEELLMKVFESAKSLLFSLPAWGVTGV